MAQYKSTIKKRNLPLLALRGVVIFPYTITTFDVGRNTSIKAVEKVMMKDQMIVLSAQKDPSLQEPKEEDLYKVGTVAKIKQVLKLPGDNLRVLVEGINRAEIRKINQVKPYIEAEVIEGSLTLSKKSIDEDEQEALKRSLLEEFEQYVHLSQRVPTETLFTIASTKSIDKITYEIAATLQIDFEKKQDLLEEAKTEKRVEKLLTIIAKEADILQLEKKINAKVKKSIDTMQREYYLREQLKAIKKELGEKTDQQKDLEDYRKQIEKRNLPKEVVETLDKEIGKLEMMSVNSQESSVIRTYIETVLELPWDKSTKERLDIKKANKVLEEDHYGLKDVKTRVLEYLAIRKLKDSLKGPILCFVGPPGVGKTSIAKSIASAINRKYARISLGGIRDEAEIRGHRKTYIGAMPGRIIKAISQAKSRNPLILLDEIDKMSSDFRGDPASAMLEVLDAEQNFSFRDHYVELEFDLSDVMFITTANSSQNIPKPLLDRMEVINLPSYTEYEKLQIAKKYLLPKQLIENGLKKSDILLKENGLEAIITYYTKEAGVRQLERVIGKLLRKIAKEKVVNNKKRLTVSQNTVEKYLGKKKFRTNEVQNEDSIGMVTGLAWTPVGGVTLNVEVNIMRGSGKLKLTGQLGDVMKESANIAISLVRARINQYNIDPEFYENTDIHIHVPEGATKKDGPSAGITLTTALVSALSKVKAKSKVAMTGEITLRGKVLPIGGFREKVLAAVRSGIRVIIAPTDNEKDLEDIPETVLEKVDINFVSDIDEVLEIAMTSDEYLAKLKN